MMSSHTTPKRSMKELGWLIPVAIVSIGLLAVLVFAVLQMKSVVSLVDYQDKVGGLLFCRQPPSPIFLFLPGIFSYSFASIQNDQLAAQLTSIISLNRAVLVGLIGLCALGVTSAYLTTRLALNFRNIRSDYRNLSTRHQRLVNEKRIVDSELDMSKQRIVEMQLKLDQVTDRMLELEKRIRGT